MKKRKPKTDYSDPEQVKEYNKKYYVEHHEELKRYAREYRARKLKELGREGIKKQSQERYIKKMEKYNKLRKTVISYYTNHTNRCVCCRMKGFDFLTIDHIVPKREMDKDPQMIAIGYSSKMHTNRLIKWLDEFKPKGFQILCWNCNFAKGHTPDRKCPHQQ